MLKLDFVTRSAKILSAFIGDEIPQEILQLAEQRAAARKAKDFAAADALRDEIARRGYEVRETRQGMEIRKIQA